MLQTTYQPPRVLTRTVPQPPKRDARPNVIVRSFKLSPEAMFALFGVLK